MIRVEIIEQQDVIRRIVGHVDFFGIPISQPDGSTRITPNEERGYNPSAGLPLSESEIDQVARMVSRNYAIGEIGDYEWRVSN